MPRLVFLNVVALFVLLIAPQVSNAADSYGPLKGKVFGTGQQFVVVFLHGDISKGGGATYHEAIMRVVAARAKHSSAIALLRPGYNDAQGLVSPGTNHNRRDQYTTENNDLVAQTLISIRALYPGARLIVVGHSGGAAQLDAVIGRYPNIVDTAILLA
ncbi:MAG: alpha/beta hydrolase [Sulfitobacter sp.]